MSKTTSIIDPATGQPFQLDGTNGASRIPDGVAGSEDWYEDFEDRAERLHLGARFLSPRQAKDAIGDAIAASSSRGSGISEDVSSELEQYEQALWVYASVFAIASNLAQVPLIAYRRTGGKEEDQPDSALQQLLDEPGEGLMTQDEIVERAVTYLELAGTEFVYAERQHGDPADPRGQIVSLRPLRPTRVAIIPGDGPYGIERYEHDVGGIKTEIHPLNCCLLRLFSPNNDFWGQSPMSVAANAINTDAYGEQWNRDLLKEGGHPDSILESDGHLEKPAKRRMRNEFERLFSKSGGGMLILDDGLKYRVAGHTPKDMEFLGLMRASMHRILAAYGVPPIAVMDLRDASVLANASTQLEMFWEQTQIPLGRKIANALTRTINYDQRFPREQGWGVRFAFEQVEALRRVDETRSAQAREDYKAGGITLNEYRQEIGQDPIDGGDQFSYERQPQTPGLFSLGVSGAETKIKLLPTAQEEFKRLSRASYRRESDSQARLWLPAMRKFFREQAKRVRSRFRDHANKSVQKQGDFADESMLAAIFPYDEEWAALADKLGPLFRSAAVDAATVKLDQILPPSLVVAITEDTDRIRDIFDKWTATRVKDITVETQRAMRDVLSQSFEDAATFQETERRMLELFQTYEVGPKGRGDVTSRAERIIRTEIGTALNSGGYAASQAAVDAGVVIRKSWLSSRDSRVRESHKLLDSETSSNPIPLGQPFANGLQHPNEMGGDAGEVVNCRCSMIEVVE